MIFADKLIQLRKKNGWSQEELAEQMDVTRQSVSKWEGAQSIPDYEKLIRLSHLFGVSIDYLLKDEIEEEEFSASAGEESPLRRVSMEEANAFLSIKASASQSTAYATFLCILSPICLFLGGALAETPKYHFSEQMAAGAGMIILLVLVATAVAIFISNSNKSSDFDFLENEAFETEYGVSGMVRERREQYKTTHTRNNMVAPCLCILSVIPLFAGAMVNEDNTLFMTAMLSVTFVIAGIGVTIFVRDNVIWSSFEKLLQENDYTKEKKEKQPFIRNISGIYWLIATAVYLAYSFITNNWGASWIVWPVAAVLFPAVIGIIHLFSAK